MFSTSNPPCAGITVLSLAEQYPGPMCTRLLCELGAEVIQIERHAGGDPQRGANPWLFRSTAQNKKSITLDLKNKQALRAAHLLVARAQVLIEGFRPGVMDRIGLGYKALHAINPKLVYCSLSGFGQDGPNRDIVGHNINYEAITGLLDPYLQEDQRYSFFPAGLPLGDILGGYTSALAIMAALRQVDRGEPGPYLDISIADTVAFAMAPILTSKLNGGTGWSIREAGYDIFRTSDGHITLGINYEDDFWQAFCHETGLESLAGMGREQRVEQRDLLRVKMQEKLLLQNTDHWVSTFAAHRVPCARARRLDEVPQDEQLAHRGLFIKARDELGREFVSVASPFSRYQPGKLGNQVPVLGGATREVLSTLGLPADVLEELLA